MTVAFPCADYIRYDRYEISMSCLDPGYFVLLDELRCTGSEDYMRLCHWLAEVCRETKVVRISDYSIGPSSLYVPMSEHRTVRPGYPTVKLTSEGSDFNDQGLQSTHTSPSALLLLLLARRVLHHARFPGRWHRDQIYVHVLTT